MVCNYKSEKKNQVMYVADSVHVHSESVDLILAFSIQSSLLICLPYLLGFQ